MGKLRANKRKDKPGSGCKMCKPWKGKWDKKFKTHLQAVMLDSDKLIKKLGGD